MSIELLLVPKKLASTWSCYSASSKAKENPINN